MRFENHLYILEQNETTISVFRVGEDKGKASAETLVTT
jgi:hypothetical protein